MRTRLLNATKGVLSASICLLIISAPRAYAQPGTVLSDQKISDTVGGFTGSLDTADEFGVSVAGLGDLDGDGIGDVAVGAHLADDGGRTRGAVWILFLNPDGTVKSHQKISSTEGGFTGSLDNVDRFGASVASVGDLDNDGVDDLAVGADRDDDGGVDRGAVWVLLLNPDGTVKSHQKISSTEGGFTGILDDDDQFGRSVEGLGDLDGDGVEDIAVGVYHDDDGGQNQGAVWVLFLNADGTVKSHQKISETEGGFGGTLDETDNFSVAIAALGDLDGDGAADVAVSSFHDDDGGTDRGAIWVLFLSEDGTVRRHQKISSTDGGFIGPLDDDDHFGHSLAIVGDLDGDGIDDLAVGTARDDDGGFDRGAVWVLFMNTDGTVKGQQKISDTDGGFAGTLDDDDRFARGMTSLGDLNGDAVTDLAVGAYQDDDGGPNRGAVYVLFLEGAEPPAGLVVACAPVNPPIVIPATGGSYFYDFSVTNNGASPITVDLWVTIDGPGVAVTRGPFGTSRTFAPGASFSRTLRQGVPGGFPANDYTHTCHVGDFDTTDVSDSFTWTKAPSGLRSSEVVESWSLLPGLEAEFVGEIVTEAPAAISLSPAYPNPFNPSTTIRFSLPERMDVRLRVFDMLGREVARLVDGPLDAGNHTAQFDAGGLPTGTYVYRLVSGSVVESGRIVLLK